MKITLPDNYSEITVGQYMELWEMYESVQDAHESQRRCIELLSGLEAHSLQEATWDSLQEASEALSWLVKDPDPFTLKMPLIRRFELKGQQYGFIPDMSKLTVGEYADLETLCRGGVFGVLNKLCAILFRQVSKEKMDKYSIIAYAPSEERKEVMKDLPMNIAVAAVVFFCNTGKELILTTELFLEKQAKEAGMRYTTSGAGMA